MDFTNKIALITGAGSNRGIGREVARQLSLGGATVILADIDLAGVEEASIEIQNQQGKAYPIQLDVSKQSEVKQTVRDIADRFGTIDILVNSAGISLPTRILEITESEWDKIFNINLKSIFYLTQEVLPLMKKHNYGRIVNLSSVAGKRGGGLFGGSHYSASKAAVAGFTKAIAREMASYGITSNCVAPGVIDTNLTGDLLTEEMDIERTKSIPLGRKGTAKDVAYTITFLASEEASYITGEEIDINGGMHID